MPADRTVKNIPADAAALAPRVSDFTAEGSPPPGRLAKVAPQRKAAVRRASVNPPARKGPAARTRYG